MIVNLLVGVGVMMLCLMVQMLLLLSAGNYYVNHMEWLYSGSTVRRFGVIAVVMLLLLLGNLLQSGVWALLFLGLDEFETLSAAYYHSLVNFATLGYGDIVMSEQWRLLGPLQAVNGVLMIGISTAAIGTVVNSALSQTIKGAGKHSPSESSPR